MQPSDIYKNLLKNINTLLKKEGFSRKGNNFILKDENWGFIGFQKSASNTASNIKFTINYGISCLALSQFFMDVKSPPSSIYDCLWTCRIGTLLKVSDKWWFIDEQTSIQILTNEIFDAILTHIIPEIKKYIKIEQLKLAWLSGKSPAMHDLQRLIYLSGLLKILDEKENLEIVISQLKQYENERTINIVKNHLRALEEWNSNVSK